MVRAGIGGAVLAMLLALGACGAHGGEGEDCPGGVQAPTPSGYCVPRYVSLKRDEVFARAGPGTDYPILFVYHAQGLPVQVVDETTDWRRICDPTGALVWVHRSMLNGRRTAISLARQPLRLRADPSPGAPVRAYLRPRAIAALGAARPGWRVLSAGGVSGWARTRDVWGAAPALQCPLSTGFAPANGAP
ncbi:MAG TPA: SH3 domain-containing protein [Caulobacteraceae bacterium]|nr:SH3 domain-containing protein [Caulobacteraceae bacterium]